MIHNAHDIICKTSGYWAYKTFLFEGNTFRVKHNAGLKEGDMILVDIEGVVYKATVDMHRDTFYLRNMEPV